MFDYVEDEEGKRKPVLNKKETAIAQGKQDLIKQRLWIARLSSGSPAAACQGKIPETL